MAEAVNDGNKTEYAGKPFEISYPQTLYPVKVTGKDATLTFRAGMTVDVADYFEVVGNAGERTYSLIQGPSSGNGSLNGSILTVNTPGIFNVQLQTAAHGDYAAGYGQALITIVEAAATPTANPAAGTYTENQSVVLTSSTEGAEIYYTTDKSTPSKTNGTKYTGAIEVTGTAGESVETTMKAIAIKDGIQDSEVATFTYIINIPKETHPDGLYMMDIADQIFTGKAIKPTEFTVYDGETELREGVDYTVSYRNNVNANAKEYQTDAEAQKDKAPCIIIRAREITQRLLSNVSGFFQLTWQIPILTLWRSHTKAEQHRNLFQSSHTMMTASNMRLYPTATTSMPEQAK